MKSNKYVCFILALGILRWPPVLADTGDPAGLCPDIPGADCAAVVCQYNPCLHGGTCSPRGNNFHCACAHGFTGATCEYDLARSTTTATTTTTKSATTTKTTTTPSSAAAAATAPTSTPPRACVFNPCRNGGFCVDTDAHSSCFCPPTYSGVLCETPSSSSASATTAHLCHNNPCLNSGLCVAVGQDFKCFCPSSHAGRLCDAVTTTTPAPVTTASTTSQTTTTPAKVCKADIQFLLDASGSVGAINFQKQLLFVSNLVHSLFEDNHDVRIGFATYSSYVYDQFHMTAHPPVVPLHVIIEMIEATPYPQGVTYTDKALSFARTTGFAAGNGERPGVADIVVIVTDGRSTNSSATVTEARRLLQTHVRVIAVGVGSNIDLPELMVIAGGPSHVYTVSNFDALKNVRIDVLNAACGGGASRTVNTGATRH